MITIGVTGGIGSGKSVVCDIFRLHGFPVYDADKEAKELNDTSPVIRAALSRHFGEEIYREGRLDRKAFASIIFQDKQKVAVANAIIHPELAKDFLKWCSRQEPHHSMAIIDAALLFEAGFDQWLDKTITVYAPKDIRLQRTIARDHSSADKVEERMNAQLPEEEKSRRSDFTIYNDNSHSLILQVTEIMKKLSENIVS
ncbi:MAG: dephospho-CoA kinase [Bacteroidetes bacterium GWD2_45_23]|jgi:dephospho-CoA kinase|nr:MAG: dephospho-CoA kinase [Bacteroidetes bacterium GWC2_46_850]OFX74588.1 MAG: dephospho-CoA kinase [Bacteroidetes bacterium GWC1_47_7]OFX87479.1 MAG: dephospho-CoA kinase [Bacteroidetes bacterium GWD2_45_23]HAR38794.1 dephospho-CoA kinase [Porphyromonadaceae bacterium]HBB01585.1 dephospho-CoA kinase [Porphyromonadaceae bacterium]